jgi:hypothetical protein
VIIINIKLGEVEKVVVVCLKTILGSPQTPTRAGFGLDAIRTQIKHVTAELISLVSSRT